MRQRVVKQKNAPNGAFFTGGRLVFRHSKKAKISNSFSLHHTPASHSILPSIIQLVHVYLLLPDINIIMSAPILFFPMQRYRLSLLWLILFQF